MAHRSNWEGDRVFREFEPCNLFARLASVNFRYAHQEVKIESTREKLARAVDTEHNH